VTSDGTLDVVTVAADGGVEQLLRRAVAHVEEVGLEVFAVVDHSGEAEEVGLSMPTTKLVLFGSTPSATRLMLVHPGLALDLPLKLLIGEDGDGRSVLRYLAPGRLAHRHGLTDDEADELRVVEAIAMSTRSKP
jgi:uncharacterized protein (DUF302 family)